MKSLFINKIWNRVKKVVNFQFSIFNFANNFQLFKLSKRAIASLFENLGIGNSLKIGNWKLVIREFLGKAIVLDEVVATKLSFNSKVF